MPPETPTVAVSTPKRKIRLLGGLKALVIALLLVIVGLVLAITVIWKPWELNIKATDRVITVNGEATITSTPDEYTFTPSYNFTNASQQTALSQLTTTSNQIVAQLKALGVASSSIQTSSNGYSKGVYLPTTTQDGQTTYELDFTITIDNADLAQKVQNYLVSTSPTGAISPSVDFSAALQKSLESKARNQAEQDARANADQSAKNLGFTVEKVKTVVDNGLNSGITPCSDSGSSGVCAGVNSVLQTSGNNDLNLQPGQNQLTYSVQVEYYIR